MDGFSNKLPRFGEDTSSIRGTVWHSGKNSKFKGILTDLILVLAYGTLKLSVQNLNV